MEGLHAHPLLNTQLACTPAEDTSIQLFVAFLHACWKSTLVEVAQARESPEALKPGIPVEHTLPP